MEAIAAKDGWLVPEGGPAWLTWGFGTRNTICKNEPNFAKQVHGAHVISVMAPGFAGEGDALVTGTPGLLLGIKTADCLPILMVDLKHRTVAAVHAGWRGTAQGIAGEAIARLSEFSGTKPIDLLVAMGPAIQKCCFEVGPEVVREFAAFNASFASATDKQHLDLQAINAWQLEQAGVSKDRILRNELCTMCQPELFWSFRREKDRAGRMWSVVGING